METIQIEVTNACVRQCSNCTRFCGHTKEPFWMTLDQFKEAVDSLEDFPGRIGVMGGEPLLHPQFEAMADYLHSRREPFRCGLWSTFPKGKEHYRELIVRTFSSVLLNDHSKPGILHTPLLVAAEEMEDLGEKEMWSLIDRCWVQTTWSASITPKGAFFCEVAGAMAQLFGGEGWVIERNWWQRGVDEFKEQKEKWCRRCGGAIPLWRRESVDGKDDISSGNLKLLQEIGSPKVKRGAYEVYTRGLVDDKREMFGFSDLAYRRQVAWKYKLGLAGYVTPFLPEEYPGLLETTYGLQSFNYR